MKTGIIFLCLALRLSAAVAFVQSAGAGSSGSSVTTTAASFTGANAIIVSVSNFASTACLGVTSSPANTWTALGANIVSGSVNQCGYTCGVPCSVSGSMTFSTSGAAFPFIFVEGFSGVATTSSYTGYVTATGTAGTCTTASVTPAVLSSAVVASLADNSSSTPTILLYTVPVLNTTTSFMGKALAYLLTGAASISSWTEANTAQTCFALAVNASGGAPPAAARHRTVN